MKLEQRLQPIRLILSDVDGVLTDGGIHFDNQGIESKSFHVRDGLGIKMWQRAGHRFGIITARSSHIVKVRMNELGVDLVRQGAGNKREVGEKLMTDLGLTPDQVCYIGDDLSDLGLLRYAGLAATVADAADEVKQVAHVVTARPGGRGAMRELIELILQGQQRWSELVESYYGH